MQLHENKQQSMSRRNRKTTCMCEGQGADQRLCFRYMDDILVNPSS